jgi:phosphatidylinositol alpha-1,6-mannosyltransferase
MVKIAPGIDTEHFAPRSDAEPNFAANLGSLKKVIVSVGRLVHRKGQDALIEALPAIVNKVPDAHLLFMEKVPIGNIW